MKIDLMVNYTRTAHGGRYSYVKTIDFFMMEEDAGSSRLCCVPLQRKRANEVDQLASVKQINQESQSCNGSSTHVSHCMRTFCPREAMCP